MKFNFLKKAGIVGAAATMMATTVMAQEWTLEMSKTEEAITGTSARKTTSQFNDNREEYASFSRVTSDWIRSPFLAYVKGISGEYKSRAGLIGGASGQSYYINYNKNFMGNIIKHTQYLVQPLIIHHLLLREQQHHRFLIFTGQKSLHK